MEHRRRRWTLRTSEVFGVLDVAVVAINAKQLQPTIEVQDEMANLIRVVVHVRADQGKQMSGREREKRLIAS